MAWGRRCDFGCESWPDELIYKKCPECGEETVRFSNLRPMDSEEARSILRHKAFERFYEVWCEQRGQPTDGPLPHVTPTFEEEVADLCSKTL